MMKMELTSSLWVKNARRRRRNSFAIRAWSKGDVNLFNINLYAPTTRKRTLVIRFDQKLFRLCASKATDTPVGESDTSEEKKKKKGSIVGAVALIIGTSIGSGILAVPKRTSPAGFIPSAVAMTICWVFLLFEAILLSEINVNLLMKKKKRRKRAEGEGELEVISIKTMAQATLGEWGGTLATVNYVFLGYTTVVAYTSKSGEILNRLIDVPPSVSGFFFTVIFTIIISVGGTRTTDQVNQWLTAVMIGLLVAIEILAASSGGWSGLEELCNWEEVPATIPVIIFTLVYHDLAPFICAYLDGDLVRIRTSFMLGSIVPLLILLVWNAVALGLSTHADLVSDPVDVLMRVEWSGVSAMVEAFSLLAVGTSLIGTLLGFSKFFLEQLNDISWDSPFTQRISAGKCLPFLKYLGGSIGLRKWWRRNKLSLAAIAVAVAPPLFISTTVPDAFSAATDIAGGYCMTMLYGVFPPAMALAMHSRKSDDASTSNGDDNKKDNGQLVLSEVKPVMIGLGICGCGIIMEQILQQVSVLHP